MTTPADPMSLNALGAWARQHGKVLVPIVQYERLIASAANALVTQAEAHNAFEAEHINLLRLGTLGLGKLGDAGCGRPPADGEFLGTRLARRLARHLPRPKLFRLWRTNG